MSNTIRFSYNWNNKLTGKAFSTIRLTNQEKYKVGETYEIFLTQNKDDKFLCLAEIAEIKHFKLANLNRFMSYLDTGYPPNECTRMITTMYKNKVKDWTKQWLSFILLVKLDPKKKNNTSSVISEGKPQ